MTDAFHDIRDYANSLTERYSHDPDQYIAKDVLTASRVLKSSGFVVLKEAVSPKLLSRLNDSFDEFVLSNDEHKLPRMDGLSSKNEFNEHSHLINPLSNVQLQSTLRQSKGLLKYSNYLLETLTQSWHIPVLKYHLSSSSLDLLTWNHIHSSPGTLPHQDYLFWGPHILPGQIYGAWIALEDINPKASPLYVVSKSHIDLTTPSFTYADIGEPGYRIQLVDHMKLNDDLIISPRLKAGDCLLWDSRLIHGALHLQAEHLTRKSLTAHYMSGFYTRSILALLSQWLRLNVISKSKMNVRFPQHLTRLISRL